MEDKPRGARWRVWLLVLVGLVLMAGVVAYRHFRLARPVGDGPAGPPVPRAAFAEPWTGRPVLLLALGDSVTRGFGATPGHGYVELLTANPADDPPEMQGVNLSAVLPDLRRLNLAISGTTSLDHVEVIREDVPVQPPDVLGIVVMTTGGNDLIHSYGQRPPREGAMYGATLDQARPWIENFRERLGEMLDLLDERFPGGCHVFLADIYDPTDGVGDARNAGLPDWPDGLAILGQYNRVIHEAATARPNVHLVPLHDTFLGHGIHCAQPWAEHYRAEDPHYWYGQNLEDPNDRGYDAIRRVFLLEMVAVREQFAEEPAAAGTGE